MRLKVENSKEYLSSETVLQITNGIGNSFCISGNEFTVYFSDVRITWVADVFLKA